MSLPKFQYEAYIIPGYDSHGSEYPADPDRRIYWMSGFNGTGGYAIVTQLRAAIWTEPRFEYLARQQLICDWEIMILGDSNYLTPWEWLIRDDKNLEIGELPGAGMDIGSRVGYDPLLMPYRDWYKLEETNFLEERSMNLFKTEPDENLVDLSWITLEGEKDPYPGEKLFVQDQVVYTGYTWQQKIFQEMTDNPENFRNVRDIMASRGVDLLIVNGLDEIAWLFNIRGEDVPFNPLFISYAAIGLTYINLYIFDAGSRLENDQNEYNPVRQHLELDTTRCTGSPDCITVRDVTAFYDDLEQTNNLVFSQKIWFSNDTNTFVYESIMRKVGNDDRKYLMEPSPILLMKAVKNSKERENMEEAFVVDSVNMIEMIYWMSARLHTMDDPTVGDINTLTEWMVSERTETLREVQTSYMYPSYETIAAIGPNTADYYYHPKEEEDVPITTGQMFLYDIGAQYREGTTTLTRTFFFDLEYDLPLNYKHVQPSDFQREIYTRVLMGHIDLAMASFRSNVYGRDLDALARQPLWDYGLDYFHSTGYGVGQYLLAHEAPVNIGDYTLDEVFYPNMIISNGPGYYYLDPDLNSDNDFGVRLTNVMRVVEAQKEFSQEGVQYLEFEMMSYVPFEPRLIKFEYLTRKQIDWYNSYNELVREKLEGKLSASAREWMLSRTRFQKYHFEYIGGASTVSMETTVFVITICSCLFQMLTRYA
ncbi:xaa-Pro aminopeptidase 1-like [Diadema setosum]|uniref:xaa-Pro aminopeptidase 1-like n=1 Tax=Diadema setosum TaxID=31175 RepID=UPI003B3BA5AA